MVWTCKMDEKRESKIVMQRGLLIILSGPSGVGKGTIRKYFETDERLNLAYSTSMTTRKPRAGEVDGRDYFFSTREDFEKAIQEGELLEWAEFVGNYYGTPLKEVNRLRDEGKNVLLECRERFKYRKSVQMRFLSLLFHLQWRNWKDVFVVVAQNLKKSFNSVLPRQAMK